MKTCWPLITHTVSTNNDIYRFHRNKKDHGTPQYATLSSLVHTDPRARGALPFGRQQWPERTSPAWTSTPPENKLYFIIKRSHTHVLYAIWVCSAVLKAA